jgi:hypothetical protein
VRAGAIANDEVGMLVCLEKLLEEGDQARYRHDRLRDQRAM